MNPSIRTPLLLLLPILLITACGEKTPPPSVVASGPKLVKALKVGVGAGGTAMTQRYSGEVRARHESMPGFRIGGKLVERLVDVGARVKAGQALARLDPGDARLAASAATANSALAAAELKRTQDLQAKNFISQAALDAKVSAATTSAAQAQLAQNQLAYTTLRADAAGVVVAVLAEPGQVVAAGQGVFRLARDGAREVAINIAESHLAGLKVGAGATVSLSAGAAGKTYQGTLRELSPAADPATRTFAARVRMVDADAAAAADVALGLSATVSFVGNGSGSGADRIVVPLAAILQQGNAAAVWMIGADHRVTQRPVEIERFADDGAVLRRGLAPGEVIVAAGAHKLTAGEQVRLAEEQQP